MTDLTISIGAKAHETLRRLSDEANEPMADVLARAIEDYRRNLFLDRANAAYLALRADPEAWAAEQEERAAWDATLLDGLEDDGPGGAP